MWSYHPGMKWFCPNSIIEPGLLRADSSAQPQLMEGAAAIVSLKSFHVGKFIEGVAALQGLQSYYERQQLIDTGEGSFEWKINVSDHYSRQVKYYEWLKISWSISPVHYRFSILQLSGVRWCNERLKLSKDISFLLDKRIYWYILNNKIVRAMWYLFTTTAWCKKMSITLLQGFYLCLNSSCILVNIFHTYTVSYLAHFFHM